MKEYIPLNQKTKKKWKGICIGAIGLIIFCLGVYSLTIYGIIGGLLILLSNLLYKTTLVNESGIVMTYDAKFYRYVDSWDFSNIEYIHREASTTGEQTMLHFTKGAISKKLVFPSKEVEEIITLAKNKNKNIFVDVANK